MRHPVLALVGALALTAAVLTTTPALAATRAATSHPTVRSCALPTKPHTMACNSLRRTDVKARPALSPDATPSGFGPTSLRSAYNLTSASSANGSGRTVAIVDAYDDPNAASDLAVYRSQYGLSSCTVANGCFTKVSQTGSTSSLPTADSGWAGEISLDLDMVSAICPNCDILLVEASSSNNSDLYTAEDYAAAHANYVSNSWGGSEYSGQTSDDTYFNHPGVAITVSSGDSGTGAEYPATSRYVTAVGGTSLSTSSNSRGWTESAWSSAGSGCSSYDSKPSWQTVTTSCSNRAEADVSAVADPNTGVAVYQTYGASGWSEYGGTSASAPIVAAVYALAGTPGSSDYPAKYPYSNSSSLYDVTSGSNGSCGAPLCTSGSGWDGPTGLGTPDGLTAFTSGSTSTGVSVTNPGSQSGVVGTATSLTLSASGGTGSYTWTASGLPTGLSLASSTGVISGTPTTAGTYSVTATATDSASATGSATFTWTVTSSSTSSCTASQLLGNPGFESGSGVSWTTTSGVITTGSGSNVPRTGSYFAWLDGYGSTHTDTVSQSVTIPSTCSSATLSFYLKIVTAETTTSTAYDTLTVKVGSTTLATYSNLNAGAYAQKSFSLTSYIGQTVTLLFTGTEDSSLATSFDIDDTAVNVS
ncbi:MAG TPA: putative Ig domain-containing protein [Rugosimonospora sp.]|nr:putative Ig domain-containing protein [Rugosimonospora sp.]